MPIQHAIWKVASQPQPLAEARLDSEQLLEDMIVAAPGLLSEEWMLIGQQVHTGLGGRIDLLAIAPDSSLVLIELKRDRTPREVVAQALDYACWVERLEAQEIGEMYRRFAPGKSLDEEFRRHFKTPLDETGLERHQIVIVARTLDDSTERIVAYLSRRNLAINVLFFRVFDLGGQQLLSRAWLLDPARVAVDSGVTGSEPTEPWNGEFYCSFGHSEARSWDDAREFGFISAGHGAWYSRTLQLLSHGDRIWVKVPGSGFVGVGRVTGTMQPATEFRVRTAQGRVPVLDVAKRAGYRRDCTDDPERCEYFVPVEWLQTVPLADAVQEIGMFGNQNTVCRPTTAKWRTTVERLKARFPDFDKPWGGSAHWHG
jgi:hypothetical protein